MSPQCLGPDKNPHMIIVGYSPAANDIWSMGVILVNLLTGRDLWDEATLTDPNYSAFIKNQNFFKDEFNLSDDYYNLLLKIFQVNPSERITLAEMKKLVTSMPSS
jgi:serine/threonine protein kinase